MFIQFLVRYSKSFGSLAVKMTSKVSAHMLYFQICWIYYTNRGIGLVIFLVAFSFAIFNEGLDMVRVVCSLYVSYFLGTVITLKLLFRSERVEAWVCREVGAEKVRRRMYNSPKLSVIKASIGGSILCAADTGVVMAQTAVDLAVLKDRTKEINARADAQVLDMERTTVRKIELAKANAHRFWWPRIEKREWVIFDKAAAEVRKDQREDINGLNVLIERRNGLVTTTVTAIKETRMYEASAKALGKVAKNWGKAAQAEGEASKAKSEAWGVAAKAAGSWGGSWGGKR